MQTDHHGDIRFTLHFQLSVQSIMVCARIPTGTDSALSNCVLQTPHFSIQPATASSKREDSPTHILQRVLTSHSTFLNTNSRTRYQLSALSKTFAVHCVGISFLFSSDINNALSLIRIVPYETEK